MSAADAAATATAPFTSDPTEIAGLRYLDALSARFVAQVVAHRSTAKNIVPPIVECDPKLRRGGGDHE